MKKLFLATIILSATTLLFGCTPKAPTVTGEATTAPTTQQADNTKASAEPTAQQTDNTDKKSEVMIVGLDDNFPPMGFKDSKGELVGFDIDLAKEVAKRNNIEVKFQPINWDAKELELKSGKVTVLWNGLTITEERKKVMLFTDAYLNNKQIILVKKDSDIKTKADLKGKNVAVQKGSSAFEAVKNDESKIFEQLGEFLEYADNVTAFLDLGIGRADAVVVDEIVGKYYISQQNPDFVILEENFGEEEYGIATSLENTTLNKMINDTLVEMKNDGTAGEISKTWFGDDIIKK